MRSLKKAIGLVLVLLLVISTVCIFTSCDKEDNYIPEEFSLAQGTHPTYASLITPEIQTVINAGMAANAGDDEKQTAVIALYNIANKSRMETPVSLALQNSDAGIDIGSVIMHGFTLRNNDKYYYQMATSVSTINPTLTKLMSEFAGLLKIGYSVDGNEFNYVIVNGSASECDCSITTFPYATYKLTEEFTKYAKTQYIDVLHCLVNQYEINNMDYCAEIIDPDSVKITLQDGYYKVHFAVDCKNGDENLLKAWFKKADEDMQVSGNNIEKYNSYEMDLEVWDNGYAKYSITHEDRKCSGMASGKPVNEFTYLWNEDEILSILSQDQEIKNKYANTEYAESFTTIDSYLAYYSTHEVVAAKLSEMKIVGIVVGSVVGAIIISIIIAAITIETGLKKGKYPKIAAKRAAKKEKRVAKKKLDN